MGGLVWTTQEVARRDEMIRRVASYMQNIPCFKRMLYMNICIEIVIPVWQFCNNHLDTFSFLNYSKYNHIGDCMLSVKLVPCVFNQKAKDSMCTIVSPRKYTWGTYVPKWRDFEHAPCNLIEIKVSIFSNQVYPESNKPTLRQIIFFIP